MSRINERKRLREIISVFLKHGVSKGIKGMYNPVHVRTALEELGPTFIKIGQILSTRPDLLPDSFVKEFQKLQDNVKPERYEEIIQVIESDLKGKLEDIFLDFRDTPIASASLAQVHLATLKGGEKVVVKIQRPRARDTMMNDIAILKRLGRFIKYTPQGSVLNIQDLVDELSDMTKKELDFLNEAHNINKFRQCNANVKYITCPKIYEEYTTPNILVMDYIDGIKITNIKALEGEGYDLSEIGTKLASNYFKQVFEDGFFHADPHPGNVIISEGKIAYVDFGIMGNLSREMRDKFNRFLQGVASRDVESIAQSILRIGIKRKDIDLRSFRSDIEEIYSKYIEVSLYDIDLSRMVNDVFKVCRRNYISMPREITMLLKGIITVEGVVAKLAPDINILDIATPYVTGHILKDRDYKREIMEQLENLYVLSRSGVKIPVKLLELVNTTLAGKLKVQMEIPNLEKSTAQLNRMVNRIVFGIIVSALIIGSSLVVNAEIGPKLYGISAFGFVGYTAAVIAGVWLLISILKSGRM